MSSHVGPLCAARQFSRRRILQTSGLGIGSLALSWILQNDAAAGPSTGAHVEHAIPENLLPRSSHFEPQIKAVIMMMQNGGPSQMELFDEKPELKRRDGQRHSDPVEQFQKGSEANQLMGSPFKFAQRGQCGMNLSEVIPCLGSAWPMIYAWFGRWLASTTTIPRPSFCSTRARCSPVGPLWDRG